MKPTVPVTEIINDVNQVYSHYHDDWIDQNDIHVWIYQFGNGLLDTVIVELEKMFYGDDSNLDVWISKFKGKFEPQEFCDTIIEKLKEVFKKNQGINSVKNKTESY